MEHEINENESFCRKEHNRVLFELLEFRNINEGWNGLGSVGPSKQISDAATEFMLNWSSEYILPQPELYSSGVISLQFNDEDGYTLGVVEFQKNDVGVFSIVDRKTVLDSGYVNSKSIGEILGIFKKLAEAQQCSVTKEKNRIRKVSK